MSQTFLTPRNIVISLLLFVFCLVLGYSAAVVGIEDNPPGIVLAYFSTLAFVLAFVHSMRTSKQYRYLIYSSGSGFICFAFLSNVFEGIASTSENASVVFGILSGAGAACHLLSPCLFVLSVSS